MEKNQDRLVYITLFGVIIVLSFTSPILALLPVVLLFLIIYFKGKQEDDHQEPQTNDDELEVKRKTNQ